MGSNTVNVSRPRGSANLVLLSLLCVFCALPAAARGQQPAQNSDASSPELPSAQAPAGPQQTTQQPSPPSNPQARATLTGKVIDQSGVSISAAQVKLTREDGSALSELLTDDEGRFSFTNLPPGPYQLTISSPDLTPQTIDGVLQPGEASELPLIMLSVATQVTEVRVTLSPEEQARLEVKDEEKQRVFGFIPNFYVSYSPNPVALPRKQKFELAWKSASDPFTLAAVGALAGLEQATNKWKQYGQGAQGYGKRFGASYADVAAGTFIGNAILPSVFKQDPRYFYEGPGHSTRSRILRALGGAFIAKHDNGNWEPNYSDVLGSAAAGGISNLYYPASHRGIGLVFSTAALRLGEITAANFFEEFLSPKFTSNVPGH